MFREIRRTDRKIEGEEAVEILKKGEYGTLSTIGVDGYPYGIPLSYVYMDNCIYFHCATEGLKLDNIRGDNKVSFCVVGDVELLPDQFSTKYESTVVFGKAVEVYDDEKQKAFIGILDKYSKDFMESGKEYVARAGGRTKIIKIVIENITGKARR